MNFTDFKLTKPLERALEDLGLETPTPVQREVYKVILSGRDVVGIAQTGTGKSFAYMLPLLRELKFSKELHPRIIVLVPGRELVLQVVDQLNSLCCYSNTRVMGVYGGSNINTQAQALACGVDILAATPGRLYDLAMNGALNLKSVKKLVIDEVDVMLDQGFRYQLKNLLEILPQRRQNLMFSATMTEEVDALIDDYFVAPARISIAVSGTPLENIAQSAYAVKNFYTKANLLIHLLRDRDSYAKVLVFVRTKRMADRLHEILGEVYTSELCVVHANKSQNYRLRSVRQFEEGEKRILLTTDVMARGLDLSRITQVISFDTPIYPENYMHRIGRTGRAEEQGQSLLFYTEKEREAKEAIEALMNYKIPELAFPQEVEISHEQTPEENPAKAEVKLKPDADIPNKGGAFHEKKLRNTKTNRGGSWKRKLKKYKKPKTRGDKNHRRRKGK